MQAQTLFKFTRSQLGVLALCALFLATSGTVIAQQRSERQDIKSEISGDTDCIISAKSLSRGRPGNPGRPRFWVLTGSGQFFLTLPSS